MKSKPLAYLSAAALGAAITIATPAMAFQGMGAWAVEVDFSSATVSVVVEIAGWVREQYRWRWDAFLVAYPVGACISVPCPVGEWSPAGARSSLEQDALLSPPLPASVSASTNSTTLRSDVTPFFPEPLLLPEPPPFPQLCVRRRRPRAGALAVLRLRRVLATGLDRLRISVGQRLQ